MPISAITSQRPVVECTALSSGNPAAGRGPWSVVRDTPSRCANPDKEVRAFSRSAEVRSLISIVHYGNFLHPFRLIHLHIEHDFHFFRPIFTSSVR